MDVEEAPNIRTLYDLWLVRFGEESHDAHHQVNHDQFWFSVHTILRIHGLLAYNYSNNHFTLVPPPWK